MKVSKVDLAIAFIMHRVGIRPSQIHEYMVQCSDGYSEVGYMRRDIENEVGIVGQTIQYFGDVIAFEATYRTNVYHNPLVVIVSINHHYKTTIFGFALLTVEIEQAYTWLLVTLFDAMEGKHPIVVLTDGDKAMRKAISKTLLQSIHSDYMSDNGLEESPHNTSTWTNIYIDRSSEPTPTQASGSWLNNSQAVGITTPTELNLFGNDSAY
ncbi:hypothetical protein WN943_011115 [Citrus x changshan-huyou]